MKKISAMLAVFCMLASTSAWADEAAVLKKLDELALGQKQILDSLEQVKSELQVVKVRATK